MPIPSASKSFSLKLPAFRLFVLAILLAVSFLLVGCETPEGGSSIPWDRPQPWERSGLPGVGY